MDGAAGACEGADVFVRDLMAPDPVTAQPDARLGELAALMLQRRIGSVVIVEAGSGGVAGIVTRSDMQIRTRQVPGSYAHLHAPAVLAKWVSDDAQLERAYQMARHLTAREVMSTPVVTIAPDATAWDATETMLERRIGHLPVVGADGVLVGVLSRLDLLRCLIADPGDTD
jgi:CBS domain-containing protein